MATDIEHLREALTAAAVKHLDSPVEILELNRLTGGSSSESWTFDAMIGGVRHELVLRKAPGGKERSTTTKEAEAKLQQLAAEKNVPVATVQFVLDKEDGLGPGYAMDRIAGETIPRKILRDEEYAEARPGLARRCGEIIAGIHSIDVDALPPLENLATAEQVKRYQGVPQLYQVDVPVFEYAARWLADHLPPEREFRCIHGDFRNGNLIVGPEGIRAILDWELAHIGDPMEDLAYISINSWRFGNIDQPVGGFGQREDLFAGYEAAGGGTVDKEAVHFWEVFSTLKWGIICIVQGFAHLTGGLRSVNRAATGRRVSETELDLLDLLT
ncbi:MAG: phosphotransferase family protein [Proteobacteria bacterium]|nr:phosphotransferase family protein [Pseudomonadota bacterium]